MAQTSYSTIGANPTGLAYRTQDNDRYAAALTNHSGSSRPSYAVAGMIWWDTSGTPWVLKMFDGTDDISLGTLNISTNVWTPANALAASNNLSDLASASTARTNLGLVIGTDVLAPDGDGSGLTGINALGFKNILINGGMEINQACPASNTDDTYSLDQWNVLTQTGAVAVTQLTLVENGTPYMQRITQSQASAQRFGVMQMVEAAISQRYRGQAVALSARVRCSASTTLRYAILEWTGTADTITSDVVNDWTSATFTAGNFFLASNLTVTATGSTALTANTLTTITALTGTLGSSGNNLIVFFWTDSTQAQNVTLDIGKAQLEAGSSATTFEALPYDVVLQRCLRYYDKTFPVGTIPAQSSGSGGLRILVPAAGQPGIYWKFAVPMRTTPTITTYNPNAANANWRNIGVGDIAVSVDPDTAIDHKGVFIGASANATANTRCAINATANARL